MRVPLTMVLFGPLTVMGAQAPAPTSADTAEYRTLAARLVTGDTTVDLRRLRSLYVRTRIAGEGPDPRATFAEARTATDPVRRAQLVASVQTAYAAVQVAHEEAARILTEGGDAVGGERAGAIVRAFDRTLSRTDGRTPDTAVEVVSVAEEYAWLRARGVRVTKQSLVTARTGGRFDLLEGVVERTGERVAFFFRLDWANR